MGIFEYIAVLTSIIIGLGLTHLMRGIVGIIQSRERNQFYLVHLLWVIFMFFNMVFWWWWEFNLNAIDTWTFQVYLFVVTYAFTQFICCALLFPSSLEGYRNMEEYFYERKHWFFGFLALTYAMDIFDSWIKGAEYFWSLDLEYFIVSPVLMVLNLVAMKTSNRHFHLVFAVASLAYQVSWAFRQYETIT